MLMYQGVNITSDISGMVLDITYTDRLGDAAGELELKLEDHEKRWQGPWYPRQGDVVNLMVGYEGESLLPCGDFQVDELELSGPPDVFYLRCLAAYITPAMRTVKSASYENQTFRQIAATIASKHSLTVIGAAATRNLSYSRVTQKQETDVQFLKRLARRQNHDFTIRGKQLVFYSRAALEILPPVFSITRSNVLTFDFKNATHRIYKSAEVSYQDAFRKCLVTEVVTASPVPPAGDTLKLVARCENGMQARIVAESALHRANRHGRLARMELPGAAVLSSGNRVTVEGFGVYAGTYLIEVARHRLSRTSGYTTEIEAQYVSQG
jgi:uncharacterized protein